MLLLVSVKLFTEPTVKLSTSNWLTHQVYPRKWPLKRCACVQLVIFIISELRHRKKIEQLRDNETHCRCPVGASAQMRSYLMSSVTRCDITLSKCRPPPKEANTCHTHIHSVYSESGLAVAPWPPKRDFGGTRLSTEWFIHLPTKVGLPSVRWPLYEKMVDTEIDLKRSRYIYSSTHSTST